MKGDTTTCGFDEHKARRKEKEKEHESFGFLKAIAEKKDIDYSEFFEKLLSKEVSLEEVIKAIKEIPTPKDVDVSPVVNAIKDIKIKESVINVPENKPDIEIHRLLSELLNESKKRAKKPNKMEEGLALIKVIKELGDKVEEMAKGTEIAFSASVAPDVVGSKNIAGETINPATEEKQDDMIAKMPVLDGGNLPVIIQDQTSELIDLYMCRNTGTTSPTTSMAIDGRSVTVSDTTGATVGDCIDIKEDGHVFQAIVQSVVGSVVSFNAPSDKAFTTAAEVCFGEWNMNYDGSGTMLTYMVSPPNGVKWDVVRIIISITDGSEMDATTFGGMPSLTNGVVLRQKDGTSKNIFIVNDNSGFAERAYDTSYDDRRSPRSEYGFRCRRTFGGQSKNGVVVRLDGDTNDELQFLIQDNLTPLDKLAVVVQGHVVEDS